MEYFEIGCCFKSYQELTEKLCQYGNETYAKFTTKDCRLIKDEFVENTEPKSRLIYTDLKLICVHGRNARPKNPNLKRKRIEKNVQTGCPAYFRLKLIQSGVALQIVALNIKHNHPLEPPKDPEVITGGKRGRKPKISKTKSDRTLRDEIKSEDDSESDQELVDDAIDDYTDESEVNFDLKGFCAPVLTPFNDDMTVTIEEIPKYAKYLASKGITALLVNSSIGEVNSLTVDERKVVLETWQEAIKTTNQHLMLQIGGCSLENMLESAKHAEKCKVNSLLCLPEGDSKLKIVENLVEYLKRVSQAAPKTPLVYHHDPTRTGLDIDVKLFLETATEKVRTFKGIYYCSSDLGAIVDIISDENRKCSVFFGGSEKLLMAAFVMGFDSSIVPLVNLYPEYCLDVLKSINEFDLTKARTIQKKIIDVCLQMEKYGNISTIKGMMNLLTDVNLGLPQPPLNVLKEEELSEIKKALTSESSISQ